jgi:hypothetical protein
VARRLGDDDAIWSGKRLQARRQVWRLTNNRLLARGTLADQIADHGKSGGNAKPHLQSLGRIEVSDGIDDHQRRAHSVEGSW